MSENTNPTNPGPTPTAAQVAGHLTMVQWVSLIVAILGAVVTAVQPMLALPQYAGMAWLPPMVMILGAAVAAATAWVKAYNVPAILLIGVLLIGMGWVMGGCQNPTNAVAASMVSTTAQAQLDQRLYESGVTTAAQHRGIVLLLRAEAAAEDAYYAALSGGDPAATAAAKTSWNAAVAAATAELGKYAVPATAPATKP